MSVRNLECMLAPRSVALIGASERDGALGTVVWQRLKAGGFRGRLIAVNPKYDHIGEDPCYPGISSLTDCPDLGVIVTPPSAILPTISQLGEAGAKAAVVITAGVDARLRADILNVAKAHCLRILGPNCLGLQLPRLGLDASFAPTLPRVGSLALLSQSGAIITAMIDWAAARDIGFSITVSMGDMADVDVGDLLNYLARDPHTRAVLMYLEHVTDARKFMSAARAVSRIKPIIAIKAGRSADAARAALSHTGALMGADDVYEAALRRAGILRVEDLGELFDAAEVLEDHRPLLSDRLAVLTNGGGAGVLAADAVAMSGLQLAKLGPATIEALNKFLPPTWSRANPVDIIGDADGARYGRAVEAVLADADVDALLVINCPTGMASPVEAAKAVVDATRGMSRPKPVIANWLGGQMAEEGIKLLSKAGIPVYDTPRRAVRGFGYLCRHGAAQARLMRTPPGLPQDFEPDRETARSLIEGCLRAGHRLLSEPEANAVLTAYGIPSVDTRVAVSPEEAEAVASDLLSCNGTERLAVKILSRDISHKSDVGGVQLHLTSPADVQSATERLLGNIARLRPDARLDGVVVQPMIELENAHELIAGLSVDRVFGPVMLFGAGGTSVEVVADKTQALPPLDMILAKDMIAQTRISRLLAGYRDRPAADREAIALVLVRISQMAADLPELLEMDINPLLAGESGVIALDTRIVVAPAPRAKPGDNPAFAIRPYPSGWDRSVPIRSGRLRIRPIRPADEALYPDFIEKLTARDIHLRFFGAFSHPTHEQIALFTQIDYSRAMAFVALDHETGVLLGVSRLSLETDGRSAEFAVLVRSDHHGRGIGTALMEQLLDYARAETIQCLQGDVLAVNAGMLTLCRDLGFKQMEHPLDPELQLVQIELKPSLRA